MKTGLSKKQKATNIYFTEADTMIEVCTYNTSLRIQADRPLLRGAPKGGK